MEHNPNDRAIWNDIFSNVPPEWKMAEPSEDMLDCLEFFQTNGASTVLDLGCGIGIWSMFMSRAGIDVKGADFSPAAIEFAREWALEEGQTIEYRCSPITIQAFPGVLFDAVIASKILDNVSQAECRSAIDRIGSCLTDTGVLFCLFNPEQTLECSGIAMADDNPTEGITATSYSDEELHELFLDFEMQQFKRYPLGFRGLFLRKKPH